MGVFRAPGGLLWRVWDEQCVVYDDASGDTHLLGALGKDIFVTLAQTPDALSPEDIARALSTSTRRHFAVDTVAAALDSLQKIGLVVESWREAR
jgi:PqqD family protein of HPr-rel-A system